MTYSDVIELPLDGDVELISTVYEGDELNPNAGGLTFSYRIVALEDRERDIYRALIPGFRDDIDVGWIDEPGDELSPAEVRRKVGVVEWGFYALEGHPGTGSLVTGNTAEFVMRTDINQWEVERMLIYAEGRSYGMWTVVPRDAPEPSAIAIATTGLLAMTGVLARKKYRRTDA